MDPFGSTVARHLHGFDRQKEIAMLLTLTLMLGNSDKFTRGLPHDDVSVHATVRPE